MVSVVEIDVFDVAAPDRGSPEAAGEAGPGEAPEPVAAPRPGRWVENASQVLPPLQLRHVHEVECALGQPIALIRSEPNAGESPTTRSSSRPRRCPRQGRPGAPNAHSRTGVLGPDPALGPEPGPDSPVGGLNIPATGGG